MQRARASGQKVSLRIDCPVRHGEGKFVMPSTTDFDALAANNQLTVRYVDPSTPVNGEGMTDQPLPFPLSPNGSMRNIAGVCDSTGLVFGLMPHPEAVFAKWLHPELFDDIELGGQNQVMFWVNGKAKDCKCSATR